MSQQDSEIAPVTSLTEIPADARCQEASPQSYLRYIACGAPAVAIVNNGDSRPYYMCYACAVHNKRNRRAHIVFTKDERLNV